MPTYPYRNRHKNKYIDIVKTPRPSQYIDLYNSDCEEVKDTFVSSWTCSVDVPKKRRKKMSKQTSTSNTKRKLNEVTPSKKEEDDTKIVDLTKPPSLSTIRTKNKLFVSYDPRGLKGSALPIDYCKDCHCPTPYCSDLVFGKSCYRHVEIMVAKNGFEDYKKEGDVLWEYMNHLNDQVHVKMIQNNISYGNYCLTTDYDLPECMKKGTYALILEDIILRRGKIVIMNNFALKRRWMRCMMIATIQLLIERCLNRWT